MPLCDAVCALLDCVLTGCVGQRQAAGSGRRRAGGYRRALQSVRVSTSRLEAVPSRPWSSSGACCKSQIRARLSSGLLFVAPRCTGWMWPDNVIDARMVVVVASECEKVSRRGRRGCSGSVVVGTGTQVSRYDPCLQHPNVATGS